MTLVGDRERERAATVLRRQYLNGRLSLEQLSERLELALRARDTGELRRAFSGLPRTWRDVDELRRAARATRRTVVLAALGAVWVVMSLVLLVAFAVAAVADGVASGSAVTFALIWLLATLLVWRARRHA